MKYQLLDDLLQLAVMWLDRNKREILQPCIDREARRDFGGFQPPDFLQVPNRQKVRRLEATEIPSSLAIDARLKDLTLVPVKPHDSQLEKIIEQLIFHSGRPILLCPEEFAGKL